MKIVKCSQCGKYMHLEDQCLYCGNTNGFDEIDTPHIHENVFSEYLQAETLVKNRKFEEARLLSDKVIEWMPNLAGIFWIRLLAKKKCASTIELLGKGFNCEDDADFCNALKFSDSVEHKVYLDIKNLMITAREVLKEAVLNHKFDCVLKTNVLQIKKSMKNEIDARKEKLLSLWDDLEDIEHNLYALEMDCKLLAKEYRETLDKSERAASYIKTETYRLEQCKEEDFLKYRMRIENINQQSEQAKADLESIKKKHLWVHSFNELVKKRDDQVHLISAEIFSLKSYEKTIQQTLNEIDRIEDQHRKAIRTVAVYDFFEAANLLGKDCYNIIFRNIGLGLDVQSFISSQDWKPTTISTSHKGTGGDDTDDYYSAWGLPNDSY